MQVITYQAPTGHKIDLSEQQIDKLRAVHTWPKTHSGAEYSSVSFGLHYGEPSMTDAELAQWVGVEI